MASRRDAGAREHDPHRPIGYAGRMTRVLLTGMSGTGKSTVIEELTAHGYDAVDTDDDDWHEWVEVPGEGPNWIWRAERIEWLLSSHADGTLFVSGCVSNQGAFYHLFDRIVLLSAPRELIVERLRTRTNNPYGKAPHELAETLEYLDTVEPLLRRGATLEVDTSQPVERVVEIILRHVEPDAGREGVE